MNFQLQSSVIGCQTDDSKSILNNFIFSCDLSLQNRKEDQEFRTIKKLPQLGITSK